jgi:hypothetical protein
MFVLVLVLVFVFKLVSVLLRVFVLLLVLDRRICRLYGESQYSPSGPGFGELGVRS